jgi:ribosomal protein S27AE
MGYKKVCFNCRKAFNIDNEKINSVNLTCPNCGNTTTIFNHKFRPPKNDDIKNWKVIEFLKDNGFVYQHIFKENNKVFTEVPYPKNMAEARQFVQEYKEQANTDNNIF